MLKILGAHPRLGEKRVETLSVHSRGEQASLGSADAGEGGDGAGSGPTEEAEELKRLNEEYEKTFPGMRYVVFVAGRSRAVIMEDMRKRIARADIEEEKLEAITAMAEIALDRAKKLEQE